MAERPPAYAHQDGDDEGMLIGMMDFPVTTLREWWSRRQYIKKINPLGLPPEGHLCPSCLRFRVEGLTPRGICADCDPSRMP